MIRHIFLIFIFAAMPDCYADTLCDDLQNILARSSDFRSIAGKGTAPDRWISLIKISDFPNCEIWKDKDDDANFSCNTKEMLNLKDVRRKFEVLTNSIKLCFSPKNIHSMQNDELFFLAPKEMVIFH